jgi:hypothetical protein
MANIHTIKNNTRALNQTKSLLNAIACYQLPRNSELQEQISKSINYLIKINESNGTKALLPFCKNSRQIILKCLAGADVKNHVQSGQWISTDKKGYPKWLGYLKDNLTDPHIVRFTLTILFISRWLSFEGEADYTIIRNSERVDVNDSFKQFLYSKENPYAHLPKKFNVGRISLLSSTKAGPNGSALMDSLLDLKAMGGLYRKKLVDLHESYSNNDNCPIKQVLSNDKLCEESLTSKKLIPRKISELSDKEGKVRLIAITDYWTQCLLKPIHSGLSATLKELYADCTFNQNHFKDSLNPDFIDDTFYSIDLKSATELMPSNWQAEVLKWVSSNEKLGENWLSLMTEHPYHVKEGEPLYFKRGQPMGVYASWPLMALTHHLIYRWALHERGVHKVYRPYFILGDDMLIIGDQYFHAYQWGIDQAKIILNKDKTFASKNFFEFAKRFFLNRVEVSPFPIGALLSSRGDINTVVVALDNAIAKSWLPSLASKDDARRKLFKRLLCVSSGTDVPNRLITVMEQQVGLTRLIRWVIDRKAVEPPVMGKLFSSISCNYTYKEKYEFLQYWLCVFLQRRALKHIEISLASCWKLQDHLFSSPLKKRPDILQAHPVGGLIYQFRRKISDQQEDLHNSFQSIGSNDIQSLIDLCITPIITHEALYNRNDKGSVRKSIVIGNVSKDLTKLLKSSSISDELANWYTKL